MYTFLSQSVTEMAGALPHTRGAYSFARSSMDLWAGFFAGLVENMEFILTSAVIVFFTFAFYLSQSII